MKLIFIYGPPAVGKFSVASELAKLTGFRLFHNHVSIQFVKSIFDFGTKPFWILTDKFRREMFEWAAKEGVDTIFTFVYAKGTDDSFIKDTIQRVRSHGGRVCFVRLYCDTEEIDRRVRSKARSSMGKISEKSKLRQVLRGQNLFSEVPFQSSISIDTTTKSPRSVAKLIAQYYKLDISKKSKKAGSFTALSSFSLPARIPDAAYAHMTDARTRQ